MIFPPQHEQRLPRPHWLLPPITAITAVCGILIWSFGRGLDSTDESLYIYHLSHFKDLGLLPIDNVLGYLGSIFHNNIVIWRIIGLTLIIISAVVFGGALNSLVSIVLGPTTRVDRVAITAFVTTGALMFYAYGPPTVSYRLASSVGILATTGASINSILAVTRSSKYYWNLVASLTSALLLMARPSVVVTYGFFFILSSVFVYKALHKKRVLRDIIFHFGLCFGWCLVLIFGFVGVSAARQMADLLSYGTTTGSYQSSKIILQHISDVKMLFEWGGWVAICVIVGTAILWIVAVVFNFVFRRRIQILPVVLMLVLHAAAVLPAIVYLFYGQNLPQAVAIVSSECKDATMLGCQGPTPAFGGAIFLQLIFAQLLCLFAVVAADFFVKVEVDRYPGIRMARIKWVLVLVFLFGLVPVSSFYTNTGWFYHSILSFGPLFVITYIALRFFPARTVRPPRYLITFVLWSYIGLTALMVFHNRLFFVHRVVGNIFDQTVMLNAPGTLAGLKVSPETATLFANLRSVLAANSFESHKDVVVATYGIPMLVVAAEARALGSAWLRNGYSNSDEVNCMLIGRDPIDLYAIKRVFYIHHTPMGQTLSTCLRERGLKFDLQEDLAVFPYAGRPVTVSVVPVK